MKYLKLYENHNPYYQKISIDEWESWVVTYRDNDVAFSDIEKEKLKSILSKSKYKYNTSNMFKGYLRIYNDTNKKGLMEIEAYVSSNEWYYVTSSYWSTDFEYFKCDQFEGLIQLIKEKIF